MAQIITTKLRGIKGVVIEFLGRGAFGEVWGVLSFDGSLYAVKIPLKHDPDRQARIEKLAKKPRPHHTLDGWPQDVAEVDGLPVYLMAKVGPPYEPLPRLLDSGAVLDLRVSAIAACYLSDAVDTLGDHGLVHSDISRNQLFINRLTGQISIIDCDEVKQSGSGEKIIGTPGYMSPKQMKQLESNSIATDTFSLGILIFEILHGVHPLLGRSEECKTFLDKAAYFDLYADNPAFIFGTDGSNKPGLGRTFKNTKARWFQLSAAVRAGFTTNFTKGLADTSQCLLANKWRGLLRDLVDSLYQCKCGAEVVYELAASQVTCGLCCRQLRRPQRLIVTTGGRVNSIVLGANSAVYAHHIGSYRARCDFNIVARVVRGSQLKSHLSGLRNCTLTNWTVIHNGVTRQLMPGGVVELSPGSTIAFGPTSIGRLSVAAT